jgi:outer membrane protein assembly factor BamB
MNKLLLTLLLATFISGEEWSQFRGPNGTGVSATTGLPDTFGPSKNVVWKTELPPGHSSPVLTSDRIFVTGHVKEKLYVISIDRKTGKIVWQKEAPRAQEGRLQNVNGPASPSPVTDGSNVYVFFQDYGLLSYDRDGKERWKVPLGPFNMFYGFGASPILVDDKVILPVDQDYPTSYLIAVDKNSGKVRWKVERPVVISGYSTPIVYQPKQGPKQIVVPESFQH